MPIYEYKCTACGFQKEHLQKASAEPLTDCPSCGKSTYTKQLTAAGFQLKGSGWYQTDFRGGAGSTYSSAAQPEAPAPAAEAAPAGCGGNCACH